MDLVIQFTKNNHQTNNKDNMDIYDQEIIDWMNDCPTHKIEVQHAEEHGAIFLVNFNNERLSNDKNTIKQTSKKS